MHAVQALSLVSPQEPYLTQFEAMLDELGPESRMPDVLINSPILRRGAQWSDGGKEPTVFPPRSFSPAPALRFR